MDKYERAIKYFHKAIEIGFIENDTQKEIYEIAIEALMAQSKTKNVELDNQYWVNEEGEPIEFKKMSESHLRNAINILKDNYSREELEGSITFNGLVGEYMIR